MQTCKEIATTKSLQNATQNYEVKYAKLQSVLCICVILLQRNYVMQRSLYLQSTLGFFGEHSIRIDRLCI